MSEIPTPSEEQPELQDEGENTNEINREEQATRLLGFLDKIHANQVFDTREHKLEFIKNLSFDEFTDLLLHINGIARNIPLSERALYQKVVMGMPPGVLGILGGLAPVEVPRLEDKSALLHYAFDRVQELVEPRDMGLIIAAALNAIHVFEDGNGRTSRLTYDLLNYTYTGSDRDKRFLMAALGKDGRFMTPDVDPSGILYESLYKMIQSEGFTTIDDNQYYFFHNGIKNRESIDVRSDLSEEARDRLFKLLNKGDTREFNIVFLATSRVLGQAGKLDNFLFVPKTRPNIKPLDANKIVEKTTEEDVASIWDMYWRIKSEVVHNMVDDLVENRAFGDNVPARDFARGEINQRLQRNRNTWQDLAEAWPEYPEEG